MPERLRRAFGDPRHPPSAPAPGLTSLHPYPHLAPTLLNSWRSPLCGCSWGTLAAPHLLPCPPCPNPHWPHLHLAKFVPSLRLSPGVSQLGSVFWPTAAPVTLNDNGLRVLKTRLCLSRGQGWARSFLTTQNLKHCWFMVGTDMCLLNEWMNIVQ